MKLGNPYDITPRPKQAWTSLTDADRIAWASEVLAEQGFGGVVQVATAVQSGTVTVRFSDVPLDSGDRGKLARGMESALKIGIDLGVTVSLMPRIDRNRIRQLRGVNIL